MFGWLAHKSISVERSPYQSSGLFGFEDSRRALEYVKKHILKFGGDPYRITLLGDGSGSQMACMHVFNLLSVGLFSKAIFQGPMCNNIYRTLTAAEVHGKTFATAVKNFDSTGNILCESQTTADVASCLRKQNITVLFSKYAEIGADRFLDPNAPFMGPLIDGFLHLDYVSIHIVFACRSYSVVMSADVLVFCLRFVGWQYDRFRSVESDADDDGTRNHGICNAHWKPR